MMMGDLPPGFSFDPTDEELVLYYLKSKIAPNLHFNFNNIPDLDFSSSHPWELNGMYVSSSYIHTCFYIVFALSRPRSIGNLSPMR